MSGHACRLFLASARLATPPSAAHSSGACSGGRRDRASRLGRCRTRGPGRRWASPAGSPGSPRRAAARRPSSRPGGCSCRSRRRSPPSSWNRSRRRWSGGTIPACRRPRALRSRRRSASGSASACASCCCRSCAAPTLRAGGRADGGNAARRPCAGLRPRAADRVAADGFPRRRAWPGGGDVSRDGHSACCSR